MVLLTCQAPLEACGGGWRRLSSSHAHQPEALGWLRVELLSMTVLTPTCSREGAVTWKGAYEVGPFMGCCVVCTSLVSDGL